MYIYIYICTYIYIHIYTHVVLYLGAKITKRGLLWSNGSDISVLISNYLTNCK